MSYEYASTDQYLPRAYPLSQSCIITVGNPILYTMRISRVNPLWERQGSTFYLDIIVQISRIIVVFCFEAQ